MADVAPADLAAAQSAILAPGTTFFLSLNVGDPGSTGTAEGTGLTRQTIVFGTPTSAVPSVQISTTSQTFTSLPGGATFTYFSVWSAVTGGSYIRGGALGAAIIPPAGSDVTVASGAIVFDAS